MAIATALMLLPAEAKDMQAYLSETEAMVGAGKHKEALERFIWFHDHSLEHDPSMYGVRLSFALSSWNELGKVYEPAKTALVETRDRKQKAILDGTQDKRIFHDVVALNRTLGEEEKTVSLFEAVDAKHPATAKEYWPMAKDAVIAEKRYDIAKKYLVDLSEEFTKLKKNYDSNVSHYDDPRFGGERFKKYNENNLVQESLKLIEVALALDDEKAAQDIQTKASSIIDDPRLSKAIARD